MARIAGIDLPREKRVEIALTYIFGIGRKSANDILKLANVDPDTRVKDLRQLVTAAADGASAASQAGRYLQSAQ